MKVRQSKIANFERGMTIAELLVALGISSVLFEGLINQYSSTVTLAYDQSIRISANLQAQAIVQTIGSEIRILGNGVPFDQPNFQIGESTLSDTSVTEPIDVDTATATNISFRLNETGEVNLLTADFNPASSLTMSLTDVTGLDINDPLYLSNSVVSGDDGLYGVITAVDSGASTVTIDAGYIASPGATFAMGSTVEEVPIVTFNSPLDGSGITRDSGFGTVLMGPNSTMELTYLDMDGNTLTLPITNTDVINSLRAIRVTVNLTSEQSLSTGTPYIATVSQTFGLRNLNYLY